MKFNDRASCKITSGATTILVYVQNAGSPVSGRDEAERDYENLNYAVLGREKKLT